MKYSEIKKHITEWKKSGLRKVPRLDIWKCRLFHGYNKKGLTMYSQCTFGSIELLHSHVPVSKIIDWHYKRYERQAMEMR